VSGREKGGESRDKAWGGGSNIWRFRQRGRTTKPGSRKITNHQGSPAEKKISGFNEIVEGLKQEMGARKKNARGKIKKEK